MNKILFLDLEDTVIDRFNHDGFVRTAVNHDQVKSFIAAEAPSQIRLFSFAISNSSDVRLYRNWWHSWLCTGLGIDIDLSDVFTTEKLFLMNRRHGHVFEDEHECMLFHGKQYGFQRYIEMSPEFDDHEVVLLDDAVETHSIHYPKRNVRLRMVNVADLLNPPAA